MTRRWAEPGHSGIRVRLLALLLPAILSLLAFDSWSDYRALKTLVQESFDLRMLESVNALRNGLQPGPDGALRLALPRESRAAIEASDPRHRRLFVGLTPLAAAGGANVQPLALLGEADLPAPPAPSATDDADAPVWYDSRYHGDPVRVVALRGEVTDGHGEHYALLIQELESTVPREQAQAASLRQELLRDARTVAVMVLLVWLGVSWSLRPLERLRRSVMQRRSHELQPLDTRGVPQEVAPLVDAVNQHLADYRQLLEAQSQFLADASHQLRTPLAIMLTQAGVALREKEPERLRETLRAMVGQITRSRRLCEQLLSLAHASEGAPPSEVPGIADLNAIAKEVVLQYLTLAREKDQDLGWIDAREEDAAATDVGAAMAVPVQARAAELHEALANLVHNAIVYTPAGGRITVRVSRQDGEALAEVIDDGPGIPAARRADVFERFQPGRAEAAGSARGGAGLGLAIARAYARRNGGDIELADAPSAAANTCGLRAILRLPLAIAHSSQSAIIRA